MTYCTLESVQREVARYPLSDSSKVSEDDIEAWCGEIGAEIDSMRHQYGDTGDIMVPPKMDGNDDENSIEYKHREWAKTLATKNVAARVLRAMQKEEDNPNARSLERDYRFGMERFLRARVALESRGGASFGAGSTPYRPVATRQGAIW